MKKLTVVHDDPDADDLTIITLLRAGWTLQRIADQTGLTRERIRQIGGDVSPQDPSDYRAPQQVLLIRNVSERVLNWLANDVVSTVEDVVAAFPHRPRAHVMAAIRDAELESLLNDPATESRERFTDDMIYDALRRAAIRSTGTLSGDQYDAWAKVQPRPTAPSRSLIIHRFGTWSAACAAAGVDVVTRKERGWTQDAMWTYLHLFAVEKMYANEPLTFAGYTAWARARDNAPSGSTLKARLFQYTPWSEVRTKLIRYLFREHGDRWVKASTQSTDSTTVPV